MEQEEHCLREGYGSRLRGQTVRIGSAPKSTLDPGESQIAGNGKLAEEMEHGEYLLIMRTVGAA